jgi:hypothetical protein
MERSNYLIWFRRMVVLGAVVGGLAASGAAAAPTVPDYGPYPISGGTGFIQVATWPTSTPDQSIGTGKSGCALGPRSTCAVAG